MYNRSMCQGFQIVNHSGPIDACARIWYKGVEVSFSSLGYSRGSCLTEIALFNPDDSEIHLIKGTVEDAIDWINDNLIEYDVTYFKEQHFDASVHLPHHHTIKAVNFEVGKKLFEDLRIGYLWSIDTVEVKDVV